MSNNKVARQQINSLEKHTRKIVDKLKGDLIAEAVPTVSIDNMYWEIQRQLDRLQDHVDQLEIIFSDLGPNFGAASPLDFERSLLALKRLDYLLHAMGADYRQVRAWITPCSHDREAQYLMSCAYRHTLKEFLDFVWKLLVSLQDTASSLLEDSPWRPMPEKKPLTLRLTSPPEMNGLAEWIRSNRPAQLSPFHTDAGTVAPPPPRSEGLGLFNLLCLWFVGHELFSGQEKEDPNSRFRDNG